MNAKIRKYTPLFIVTSYLLFTILLFSFGPLNWNNTNNEILIPYLLINIAFVILGYFFSIHAKVRTSESNRDYYNLSRTFIIISFVFTFITFFNNLNLTDVSLAGLIDRIILSIEHPELSYSLRNGYKFGGKAFIYASVLISPIIWSAIPLSMYFFNRYSIKFKFLIVFLIMFEFLSWFVIGTNKGLFDLFIIFLWVFLLKKKQKKSKNFTKRVALIVFITIILSIFLNNIEGRLSYVDLSISQHYQINESIVNLNDGISVFESGLIHLTNYLTQGYYGLSHTFSSRSSYLFGIGSSYFLIENTKDFFGINLDQYLLQFKVVDSGWSPIANWHSVYTSFANEVGFLFVPIVMFIYAYLFGLSIKILKKRFDILSFIVSTLLIIFFFYVPANHQIMQYPRTGFTFLVVIPLWLFYQWGGKWKSN